MEYMEQQMQNYIEAGISAADRCYARIDELEEQNVALAAQVEALCGIAYLADGARVENSEGNFGEERKWLDKLYQAAGEYDCTKTPQQHLREIRAEAIEQAATYLSESIPDQSHKSVIIEGGYVYISTRYLRQYAESILKGELSDESFIFESNGTYYIVSLVVTKEPKAAKQRGDMK